MRKLDCQRCGRPMKAYKKTRFQLGETGWFLGDLSNLLEGSLTLELYACPDCGKVEFFLPEKACYDLEDVGELRDELPQVQCPQCGAVHDFDYPKCPNCGHGYPLNK